MPSLSIPRALAMAPALLLPVVAGVTGLAAAQTVNDFRLPPGRPAPAPAPAGPPADEGRSRPSPAAPATEAPPEPAGPATGAPAAESPAPAPVRVTLPAPADPAAAPSTAPRSRYPAGQETPASPVPPPASPAAATSLSPAAPIATPNAGTAPAGEVALASTARWWWLGSGALLGFLTGALLIRRRKGMNTASGDIAPNAAEPLAAALHEPDSSAPNPLQVRFEPLRMSLSLVNATLRYRLTVSNPAAHPITALVARLDMIAAHAGPDESEQLAGLPGVNQLVHHAAGLEPAGAAAWSGELRLRLDQIAAIHQGSAALFVPLVRIAIEQADGLVQRTFVVGEPVAGANGRVAPFRLDLGPRIVPAVMARPVA